MGHEKNQPFRTDDIKTCHMRITYCSAFCIRPFLRTIHYIYLKSIPNILAKAKYGMPCVKFIIVCKSIFILIIFAAHLQE